VPTLPPFALHRPTSAGEASQILDQMGDDAVVHAGGTELLLVMKLGFAEYAHLVDVKGIAALHRLEVDGGTLTIGGAVTHREIERSPLVRDRFPALAEMESMVANVRVRTAGTLGGNLAFADPHSDPATFLLATGAEIVVVRGDATRTIPMDQFLRGPYETAIEPGELLAAVRIPLPAPGTVTLHRKMSFFERPAVTVTCAIRREGAEIVDARIAVGSVGVVPERMREAEAAMMGPAREGALDDAAEAAASGCTPMEDRNGAEDYKRNLVRVLVRRTMLEALGTA
jgi:aerobic carbon-monoxide dehydrogenase medium subunit